MAQYLVRNGLAKVCEKYLTKGDKVYVEGKLKNRQWEQDGVKRYATEVQVNEMTMLSTKNANNNPAQQNEQPIAQPKTVVEEEKDDLPF